MKNDAPRDTDLHELGELIDGIEVAMLTTHAADGSLVSRPVQTLKLDANGELIFFTAANSHKIAELTDDADANLAYAHAGEHRYVSVRGRARMDRDDDTIDELWTIAQKIFFPDGRDDPNLMVLRIRVRDAVYWETADSMVARAFDFARGLLEEKPSDLGKQGRLEG
ncbi:pyridoxamine 5'-phosphate oxidase family protein [Rhodanobacter lindaniclasticus]|uniref:Pyridoxamine 5'-phosphate oxidase n=1 Tax=Rhodanobacter lindaniclasticus TaxID=75310 RepID=A0A4S3KGS8_9GAMM|nr:pyridoxamine 5'-phosphate oxidase family protein [Rhodanobacter lindaniclasticus]THD07806.1 pyridoxamine 5'-phosphate oxidase [Rhodanobacter lindaniclasticus]